MRLLGVVSAAAAVEITFLFGAVCPPSRRYGSTVWGGPEVNNTPSISKAFLSTDNLRSIPFVHKDGNEYDCIDENNCDAEATYLCAFDVCGVQGVNGTTNECAVDWMTCADTHDWTTNDALAEVCATDAVSADAVKTCVHSAKSISLLDEASRVYKYWANNQGILPEVLINGDDTEQPWCWDNTAPAACKAGSKAAICSNTARPWAGQSSPSAALG